MNYSRLRTLWQCVFVVLGYVVPGLLGMDGRAHAQSPAVTGEIDLDMRSRIAATGGSGSNLYSTTLRLGTDLAPGLRVQLYGTHRYGAFEVQQALVEKDWGGAAGRLQIGQVQVPFGIYDVRETYASGLIDYPLARGDFAFHSVDWGAPGAEWSGGLPRLQVEAAGFSGQGTGVWGNQTHLRGAAGRAQTYAGDAIVGLSRWDGALQDDPASSAFHPVHMTGLDWRFTKTQLLIRGEYLFGTLAGDHMHGWYVDAYYRLPQQQKWSLAARLERLKPGEDYAESRQITLGVRYIAAPDWTLAANWRHNNGPFYGFTWTPTAAQGGDIYLQAYHRVNW